MKFEGTKKIFYQDSGYPINRNLVDLPLKNYTPLKKIGILKILNHLHYKLSGNNPLLSNTHWELFKKSDGIWHFFNGVSFGNTPWVTTFETGLPRWHTTDKSLQKWGIKALAAKSCKKLIAISECTKNYQRQYLDEKFPSFKSEIVPKITVIHPAQKPIIQSLMEKNLSDDRLIFTIIGADFFRKGGREILRVFRNLLQKKLPVELNIISTLQFGDYASKTTAVDLKEAQKIINTYSDNIHYYKRLPNADVLQKLKNSHIGLLPTYADTYGYSVLEAQACGCPVITTNIRALPEINNDDCGWVIKVPKDRWGNGVLKTLADRDRFSEIIEENLYEIISDIIANPDQIPKKRAGSIQRIKREHDPEMVACRLEKIYDGIITNF